MTDVELRADGADARTALTSLTVAQLQARAAELGIPGAARLRKGELVNAIIENQDGADASSQPSEAPAETEQPEAEQAEAQQAEAQQPVADEPVAAEAPAAE
ncbi:MAG TPA: Rho termination factor N-terminal domain-containing protein, partial [Rhodoglobus sp.]|nr:Rho termination factor N-terminal domain-containing protein [Rhodoglobus sp.]